MDFIKDEKAEEPESTNITNYVKGGTGHQMLNDTARMRKIAYRGQGDDGSPRR